MFRKRLLNIFNAGNYVYVKNYLATALDIFQRVLPHIQIQQWEKSKKHFKRNFHDKATWKDKRTCITLAIKIRGKNGFVCIENKLIRKVVKTKGVAAISRALDMSEKNICDTVLKVIYSDLEILHKVSENTSLLNELAGTLDERVIITHLKEVHKLNFDLSNLINYLRELSEQSYENKTLSCGVLIDKRPAKVIKNIEKVIFPDAFLKEKKFKAFTDGYRSSYLLNSNGEVKEIVDLEELSAGKMRGEHYFPEWSRNMALSTSKKLVGLSLTRQGDILLFDKGSLRFSRRAGKWQYWNHAYIIDLLTHLARAQKVQATKLGKVVSILFRFALDVSFRHTGGMFVVLRKSTNLRKIVREGDALNDRKKDAYIKAFEKFLKRKSIIGLGKNVFLELASIDGAMIIANNGRLLAYGAVLKTSNKKKILKAEGSRSKAAISSSYLGISIKISSDGDISLYRNGVSFIQI